MRSEEEELCSAVSGAAVMKWEEMKRARKKTVATLMLGHILDKPSDCSLRTKA